MEARHLLQEEGASPTVVVAHPAGDRWEAPGLNRRRAAVHTRAWALSTCSRSSGSGWTRSTWHWPMRGASVELAAASSLLRQVG